MYLVSSSDKYNIHFISDTDNIRFLSDTDANISDGYLIFRIVLTFLSMSPLEWRCPKQIRVDLVTADNIIIM